MSLNNTSGNDDFALVPRSPSAVEKAQPGAKRIVSGMVADTLALVKKRKIRVLTCSGNEAIVAHWTALIQIHLGETYDMNIADINTGSGILEFVQQHPIDLIVALVNNILVPATDGNDRILKAVELLTRLKAEYGIPIIALSTFEPKSFDLPQLLKGGGIDAFLWAPYDNSNALKALDDCLKTLGGRHIGQKQENENGVPAKVDFTDQPPLGKCPKCGGNIFETDTNFVCEHSQSDKRQCRFKVGKMILHQPIEREQVQKLLETGQTDLLSKFISRAGNRFSAYLVVDQSGRITFEFRPHEP